MLKRDRKRLLALLMVLAILVGVFAQPTRDASANENDQPQPVAGSKLTTTLEDGSGAVVNLELDAIEVVNLPTWENHPYSDKYWVGSGSARKLVNRGSKVWWDETQNGKIIYHESRNIKIQYTWNTQGATQLKAGDYFLVPLPQADRFTFTEENKKGVIKGRVVGDSEHTVDLGTFEIRDEDKKPFGAQNTPIHYARLVLNEAAAQRGVENGLFTLIGTTVRTEVQTPYLLYAPLEKVANITFGTDFLDSGNNLGTGRYNPEGIFDKRSDVNYNNKNITWYLDVNTDYIKHIIESKDPMPEKENLVIVDTLPEGVENPAYIHIRTKLYLPFDRDDNDDAIRVLGNHHLDIYTLYRSDRRLGQEGYDHYGKIAGFIGRNFDLPVLKNNQNLDYDAFVAYLKSQNRPGIFVDQDGSRKLIYTIHRTPLDFTYYELFNGQEGNQDPAKFHEFIDAYTNDGTQNNRRLGWISKRQAEIMKEVYGINGPSKGKIGYVEIRYTTVLDKPVNGEAFINSATMDLTSGGVPSHYGVSKLQQYVTSAAQGEIPEIHVSKVWGSSDSTWNEEMKNSNEEIAVTITPYGMKSKKTYESFVQHATLSKSNNWKTVVRVPVEIINREKIEYKVEENIPDGKEYKLGGINRVPGAKSYIRDWTITNVKKNEIEKVKIDVNLITCDDTPKAAPVDAVYTVQRRLKNVENDSFVDLTQPEYTKFVAANSNETSFSFGELEKYDAAHQEYEYKVVQMLTGPHNLQVTDIIQTDPLTGNFIAIFKNCPPAAPKASVTVQTVDCAQEVKAPVENVTVKLQRKTSNTNFEDVMNPSNPSEVWTQTVTTADTSVTFGELAQKDDQDNVYTYRVVVTSGEIQGYTTEVLGEVVADAQNPQPIKVKICPVVKPPVEKVTVQVETTNCSDTVTAPPQDVTVKLQRKTENSSFEDVMNPNNTTQAWTETITTADTSVTFGELVQKDDQDNVYTYRVVVTSGDIQGYTTQVLGEVVADAQNPDSIKVKICLVPVQPSEKTTIIVQTVDCSNSLATPPQEVEVKLQKSIDGASFEDVKDPADSNETWTKKINTSEQAVTFEDLPKKDDQGNTYTYKVEVISGAIAGYTMEVSDNGVAGDNNLNTIKIKICPEQKPIQNISVTVQTTDCSSNVGAPLEDVVVRIQRKNENGDFVFVTNPDNNELYTLTIKKDTNGLDPSKIGKVVFEKLPQTDTNGAEIEYKVVVTSDAIAGHTMKLSDDGIVSSANANTINVKICPIETIDITVQNTDCSDLVVAPPQDIAIVLQRKLFGEDDRSYAQVVKDGQNVETVLETTKAGTHTFSDLPKTNEKGTEYVYKVVMNPKKLDGYVTTLSDDGEVKSTKGNTVTIKNCKNFDITVQNKDCTDTVKAPPVDFSITLQRKLKGADDATFANVTVGGADLIQTLSKDGNGTHQFTDLPKFSPSGVEYVYRVVFNPDKVDQYETTVEDAGIVKEEKGFVVTVKNCPLGTGGPSNPNPPTNPPSNPNPPTNPPTTPPTTPDTTPENTPSDNSGSGTISSVERLTPNSNNPQNPSDSGSDSDSGTSTGNTTFEKPVDPITGDTASTGGPSTDVKPGVIPGLSSGTGAQNPGTAVNPANKGNLPKTGEGLNMETYAMILAFFGISLVSYGVFKRRRNH